MSSQEIPSPLPGTFYRRPSPDAPPFVEPRRDGRGGRRDRHRRGHEAVHPGGNAGRRGGRGFLAEDGDPVDIGQPLLRIKE